MMILIKPRKRAKPVNVIAEELRDYTNGVRRLASANVVELTEAEKELRTQLRGVLPLTARVLVTHPMRAAAEDQKHAAGHAVATWLAFMREYVPESFGRVALRNGRSRRTGRS